MTDPRIIPLLDPEPTEEELEHGKSVASSPVWSDSYRAVIADSAARIKSAERVRIARQAIEWAIGILDDNDSRWLKHCLFTHDAAIREREGNRERD